jgi:hypothetical protein
MIFNWPKFVAKMVLYALIAAIIFMMIVWGVVMVQSNNIMTESMDDLVYLVSEENCLSKDGGSSSTYTMFCERLKASETSWLTFDVENDAAISVKDTSNNKDCFTYASAPQRGTMITCKLSATVTLPVMIAPMGQRRLSVTVSFEKVYTTMALKYYKDKA